MKNRVLFSLLSFCIFLSAQAQSPKYQLIQGDFDWFEAKLDAEQRGGHLATITSQQEWDAIRAIIPQSVLEGKTIWIGGTDSRVEGQWEWITGEPWGGFLNWRGGEPNGTGGGGDSDYLEMTPLSGSPWNDAFGTDRLHYLLEYEFPLPAPRYQLVEGSFTWYEAKADAEKRGGHLVTITSEAERQAVLSILAGKRLSFWIGLVRLNATAWTWITGEASEYSNWSPGQPNGGAGLGDVTASSSPGLTWDDLYKDQNPPDRLPYILEFEPNPQSPVQIEFVTVGDPGNPPDSTGYGKVDYVFQIGKFEVNNLQYAAFLNAKAKSDPHSLYDSTAIPNNGIVRSGIDGAFSYSIKSGMEHKPVTCVNFYKAMRFANWLHNGGLDSSDTETGAYTFGSNGALPTKRNTGAKYFVPSENEWYKAAYYQPTSAGGPPNNYWLYATRSNVAPVAEPPPGGSNSANYENALPSSDTLSPLTDVGAYVLARSYYGTFDQTGSVWEWNETALLGGRSIRGGSIGEPGNKINSQFRFDNFNDGAGWEAGCCGFRLAAAFPLLNPPQPPSLTQLPVSQAIARGSSVTLSVTAIGTGPLSYQWRFNGKDIAESNSAFTITNFQPANAGGYSVVVSNAAGSVTSSEGILLLMPILTVIAANGGTIIGFPEDSRGGFAPNSSVTITAQPNPGYVFLGWSGDVIGSQNPITITMDRDKSISARFAPIPMNAFTVSRLAFGQIQGFRIPVAPPDRTAFAIETSVDFKTWIPLITFPTNSGPFEFIDASAVNHSFRFYRAVKR